MVRVQACEDPVFYTIDVIETNPFWHLGRCSMLSSLTESNRQWVATCQAVYGDDGDTLGRVNLWLWVRLDENNECMT